MKRATITLRSSSGNYELLATTPVCESGPCVRISCVASEPHFAAFCCKMCAESNGLNHSKHCNEGWAHLEPRIVRVSDPPKCEGDPVNDQVLIEFLELGGILPEASRAHIHALTAPPPRPNYETAEADRIEWAKMDLDARLAELVEWIKAGTPDAARARIHGLTRKFSMTVDDLELLVDGICPRGRQGEMLSLAIDLRDRYEERGKYAPQ